MGCHFLIQGIFPTQRQNPSLLCLLHWQAGSLHKCHLGSPDYRWGTVKVKIRTVQACSLFSIFVLRKGNEKTPFLFFLFHYTTTGALHPCRIPSLTVQFQWPLDFPRSKFSYFFPQTGTWFIGFQVQMTGRASDWPSWVRALSGRVTHALAALGAGHRKVEGGPLGEDALWWVNSWCTHRCNLGYTLRKHKDYDNKVGGENFQPHVSESAHLPVTISAIRFWTEVYFGVLCTLKPSFWTHHQETHPVDTCHHISGNEHYQFISGASNHCPLVSRFRLLCK